jgi:hypothetical protein
MLKAAFCKVTLLWLFESVGDYLNSYFCGFLFELGEEIGIFEIVWAIFEKNGF